ncbi:MAG: hypothetical protein O2819_06695 [Planctomycetota bacterium]|nr:hypothetical protein [Planctomycetota bacterium]MDA1106432.1 hypothetical protein [Planctomycetota bacterium]
MSAMPPSGGDPRVGLGAPATHSSGHESIARHIDAPRRISRGLRLRHRAGPGELSWHAARFAAALESSFSTEARADGLEYAIIGQTSMLKIEPARVRASVQGRAPRPYELTLRLHAWTEAQWDQAVGAMAAEAAYTARLIKGEFPSSAPDLMARLGLDLWPVEGGTDAELSCQCGQRWCKHAWAVVCHLSERIQDDPLILFSLRGMPASQLLERLRERRNLLAQGTSVAHPPPPMAHAPPLLAPAEACLHDFWRPGPALEAARAVRESHHLPHALLRRLGQSPMQGKFPVVGLLSSAYDAVRDAALNVRDSPASSPPSEVGSSESSPGSCSPPAHSP